MRQRFAVQICSLLFCGVTNMGFQPYIQYRKINVDKVMKAASILFDAMNYKKKDKKLGIRFLYGEVMHNIVGKESSTIEFN